MIRQIQDLVQFYAQKFHVPIEIATKHWQLDIWRHESVFIALPEASDTDKTIEDMTFSHSPKFGKELEGDLIVVCDLPMAWVGSDFLLFLFLPTNQAAWNLVRTLIDRHTPKLCRAYRHRLRENLVQCVASCVDERKNELQASIKEDGYELERTSTELMTLARRLESDRQMLRLFEKSPEWIKARSVRTFVDLMKLMPATYANIRIENDNVIGETHSITIEYDGGSYRFEPYTVKVDVRKGKVLISGGTEVDGFVHPHVKDDPEEICWGNIGHLIARLTGEMDLFGLFTLINQFLNTYNDNDPFQRIEKWDPNWVNEDDDDDQFCSWCDDYGHDIAHCDWCWWCEHCSRHVDHDDDECPNCPKDEGEEEEESDAVAEEA